MSIRAPQNARNRKLLVFLPISLTITPMKNIETLPESTLELIDIRNEIAHIVEYLDSLKEKRDILQA